MTLRLRGVLVSILALAALTACSAPATVEQPGAATEEGYRTFTIDEFATILEAGAEGYTVVNVHIPYEGELPNTDLEIPFNDIEALTGALPDRSAPIILYCRSGRMSQEASEALVNLGYTHIWDVPGGMNAWRNSGRALIQGDQSP